MADVVRPPVFADDGADLIRTDTGNDHGGVEWGCFRCGMDIELGQMYRTEVQMHRHTTCPRRGRP